MIDKLINATELSKLLTNSDQAIRKNKVPVKYNAEVQELNDLINYWKKRYKL